MYKIKPEKTHTHLYVERRCLSTLTPVNSLIFPQSLFFRPGYLTWPIEHRRRLSYYDIRPVQFHGRQALWALFSSFGPQREALWDSSIHWLALGDKRHLVWNARECFWGRACVSGGVLRGCSVRSLSACVLHSCVVFSVENECVRRGEYWSGSLINLVWRDVNHLDRFWAILRCYITEMVSTSRYLTGCIQTHLYRGRCCLVFCTSVRCGSHRFNFGRGCGQNTGVLSWAVCCVNKPVFLKVSRNLILYLLNTRKKHDMSYEQLPPSLILQLIDRSLMVMLITVS